MTLSAPDLSLDSGPHGVQAARRWVVHAVAEAGRPDLAECAEMAVSELVTNALLHGAAPITVRVGGTHEHPRVEVRDSSTEPPVLPGQAAPGAPGDLDASVLLDGLDLVDEPGGLEGLLTVGRGLSIVARASDAWGAEIEPDGKVVWFVPALDFAEDQGPAGSITGLQVLSDAAGGPGGPDGPGGASDSIELHLLGVPVGALGDVERYFRELRREVRLLALAHHDDYPMAGDLADLFGRLERPVQRAVAAEQLAAARHRGRRAVDLVLHLSRHQALGLGRFVDLLDLTDAFCREEKMLTLARTPQQRQFQNWFLSELVGQAEGRPAVAWTDTRATLTRRSSAS